MPARGSRTTCGWDRHTLAPSNAALVRRTVEICEGHGRTVATPAQARETLGLRPAVA